MKMLKAFAVLLARRAGLRGRLRHARDEARRAARPTARAILYYVDAMNPAYKSDKPRACCRRRGRAAMTARTGSLLPRCSYHADSRSTRTGTPNRYTEAAPRPPGRSRSRPSVSRLIGVKFATVELSGQARTIRSVGKVTFDETRVGARAHADRRLDRKGVRRLHGRLRQAGPADADDLQPGNAGVATGAAARRARAGSDARQPAGLRGGARQLALRAARRRLRALATQRRPNRPGARTPARRFTASRCTRRPAVS